MDDETISFDFPYIKMLQCKIYNSDEMYWY